MATILGYIADWSKRPLGELPWKQLTHAVHAFATLDDTGRLHHPTLSRSAEIVALARRHGVQPLLALGGAESGRAFARATESIRATTALCDDLVQTAHDRGYAGLDIDWEFVDGEQQASAYLRLLETLRAGWPDALLTTAVPAGAWNGRWIPISRAARLLNFLHVMAYDFAGPWGQVAGHHASLNDARAALDYWIQQRHGSPTQLLLGIPIYGRGFRATHWGEKIEPGSYDRSYLGYQEIQRLQAQGWTARYDPAAKAPYLEKPGGGELLSIEDPDSARRKGELARARALAGVFFWEVTLDASGFPLIDAACQGLTGTKVRRT